jgi:hypothetical protein
MIMSKTETLEEFLARGGEVKVVDQAKQGDDEDYTVKSTAITAPKLYHLTEAELIFGRKRKVKNKKQEEKMTAEEAMAELEKISKLGK